MTRVELKGIVKRYGDTTVLPKLDLSIEPGEFLVLLGPSGCGKSTLLRILAGLLSQTEGSVSMDGMSVDELDPAQRDVAMVFQNYALYPHRTVAKNLSFPLEMRRVPRTEIARRVKEVAESLGLEALLDRKPAALSGGQMQRVALGRAVIREPRVFLFDEPLSNLDASMRTRLRDEIAELHRRTGITTVYVTHDQSEAMTLGTRVAVMQGGRLEQVGAPLEVYGRPATCFVAGFVGTPRMNLIDGRVFGGTGGAAFEADGFAGLHRILPAGVGAVGDRITLGVRPSELKLQGSGGFRVCGVERMGSDTRIRCQGSEGGALRVWLPGDVEVEEGSRVGLEWPDRACHWFDTDSGRRLAEVPLRS